MNRQVKNYDHLYNQKTRLLFKQLICETDCLYDRVISHIDENSASSKTYFSTIDELKLVQSSS